MFPFCGHVQFSRGRAGAEAVECRVGRRAGAAASHATAAIAQLGGRQTEDLKVPSSILGLGMFPPAPAPRVGLGGRNLSCGGGQGGCKACVFADPAACPLHAAPCYLGPRQREGARRRGGGEPSRRHARWTPQASAWVERATAGGAFRARRAQSHKAAAYWIA